MIKKLLTYIADSTNPYENLAVEKYLFDSIQKDTQILYLWQNKDTVVIGQNQNPLAECQCSLIEQDGAKIARRLSGGGAVYHDLGNLNFTFISNSDDYSLSTNLEVIKTACSYAGIDVFVSGRNDILADEKKFSGNAFYNSNNKSYHHGTILINTDFLRMQKYLTPPKAKLEAKGIKSVKSRVVNLSELSPAITCEKMTEYMILAFESVYNLKSLYSGWDYIYAKSAPFTLSTEEHFPWGNISLNVDVTKGIIKNITTYTDSMDWRLPKILSEALTDCRFEYDDIKKALELKLESEVFSDILTMFKKII